MVPTMILHPFLLALYPILALLSTNFQEIPFSSALRSLLVIPFGTGLLLILFRLLVKDWLKAGALCSLSVVLFFSYGHVYDFFKSRFHR